MSLLSDTRLLSSKRLGTRMIPHVQPILALCCKLLASASSLVAAVTELLSSITIAVPTFISSEQLMQTIASVIRTPGVDVDRHLNSYIATLTKRVPTGTLLPSLLGIWQDTRTADEKVGIIPPDGMGSVTHPSLSGPRSILLRVPEDHPPSGSSQAPCTGQDHIQVFPGSSGPLPRPQVPHNLGGPHVACIPGSGRETKRGDIQAFVQSSIRLGCHFSGRIF